MKSADTRVNHGGLMRCCLQSLALWCDENPEVDDGTKVGCRYEKDPNKPVMVLQDGTWHWVGSA